ncbi:helix-turn-helix transcriptional regulator [Streptomyces sp. NBC_00237]|uniref:response regulator transcription factor n=1 Tax=Streptomyces sp. NBC_00237 TaxID=2975687 RepID=UPI002255B3E4|nr:helix-turn-helix transcriptional regulator [Streptomyces sp. NBC_00237]MCX5202439.1 helix-turn-helix transcriptional regulator [Streptomyces sp. NBC_00237]
MTRVLTRRQRDVLLLAANGNTNAQIARWLGVSSGTVGEILNRAYRTLGAHDRGQAVALALKLGEFGVDDIRLPFPVQREDA